MTKKQSVCVFYTIVAVGVALGLLQAAQAGARDRTASEQMWAWGTNAGWINLRPAHGGVAIYSDHLEGYAWGENIGWIRLGSYAGGGEHTYGNTSPTDYGVNRDRSTGELSGYAWGTNVGWIRFDPAYGGVRVCSSMGDLAGYAWAENVGWIRVGDATCRGGVAMLPVVCYDPTPTPSPTPTSTPTPTPTPTPRPPLFVGMNARWDGEGYIRTDLYYDVGWHHTRELDAMTDGDTIRSSNHAWYAPNPRGWDSETWNDYYSVSTGYFRSSSNPSDPAWQWHSPWILPYDWQFQNGQTFRIDGKKFRVSGPHSGYTAFGVAVQYWQLVNEDKFKFYEGGDWDQYVHAGDIVLRYDAGTTRLWLHYNVLRREYYKGDRTSYTVQYIVNLTASNSFSGGTTTGFVFPTPSPDAMRSADHSGGIEQDSSLLPGGFH